MNGTSAATSSHAGFAHPAWDSQAVFRRVLEAMAHPGRVGEITLALERPAVLDLATAAVCLTLLDFETPVWLQAVPGAAEVAAYLRFQCGCPLVDAPEASAFAVVLAPDAAPPLHTFPCGTAEQPDRGATLLMQIPGLQSGASAQVRGPGVATVHELRAAGLPPGFWHQWRENQRRFPLGVDLVLTSGSHVAALPRTVIVEG